MYHNRQQAMLISTILTLQNAWAAAITELGGLTYLLVENQVKKERLIESILLSDINKQKKKTTKKTSVLGTTQAVLTLGGKIL